MVRITPATPDDAALIRRLAQQIWWPAYSPILSADQISYMLDLMYSEAKIRDQVANRQQSLILLYEDDMPMGFAAYAPRDENPNVYKLHKLYCLTEQHGKGYGRALLEAVEAATVNAGVRTLELNVNRHNPAIGFYEKQGFKIIYSEDIQIGNGYEMNDYVMQKLL